METSFEWNNYNVNVFGVNLHDRELRIQGDFNFKFRQSYRSKSEYFTHVDDQGQQHDCKTKMMWVSKKQIWVKLGFLKKPIQCGWKTVQLAGFNWVGCVRGNIGVFFNIIFAYFFLSVGHTGDLLKSPVCRFVSFIDAIVYSS